MVLPCSLPSMKHTHVHVINNLVNSCTEYMYYHLKHPCKVYYEFLIEGGRPPPPPPLDPLLTDELYCTYRKVRARGKCMYKGDTTVCTLLLCTVHVVMSSGRMSCSIDNQKCMCNETENVCVSIITREDYRFFPHVHV